MGDLTDDDITITQIKGKREQLEGALQNRYDYAKDKAREEAGTWSRGLE